MSHQKDFSRVEKQLMPHDKESKEGIAACRKALGLNRPAKRFHRFKTLREASEYEAHKK